MTHLVKSKEAEPIVEVIAAEERMREPVSMQIALLVFLQQGHGLPADLGKSFEHWELLADQAGVQRNGSLHPDHAPLNESNGQVHLLPERHSNRGRPDDSCRDAGNFGFNHRQVGNNFTGRPAAALCRERPLFIRNSGAEIEQACTGSIKVIDDRRNILHWSAASGGKSTRCLEGVSELKDSRFAEVRAKNLHPHGQTFGRITARHGNPRDARE